MPKYVFDTPIVNLRGRVTSGLAATSFTQGVRVLVSIVSMTVLSRLLRPSEFGVVAMAGPVLAFATMFQDLGLTQATVQKPILEHDEASQLFWINLAASFFICGAVVGLSPFVGRFYGDVRAGYLTAAFGGQILVAGFGTQHSALLNRAMRFGALAIIDVISAVGGVGASIAVALIWANYWALFLGSMANIALSVVLYWVASGWRPALPMRDGPKITASLHFGAGIVGFNFANFFARNLDNILIGKVWGELQLGLYDRAYRLLLLPIQQINNPLSKVMLPALSRMQHEPDRYRHAFLRTVNQLLLVAIPGVAFMTGTAPRLVPTLLGPQWKDAAPIFAVLGYGALVQTLNNVTGWLFISQGRTDEYMKWGWFSATTCVLGFIVGLPYGTIGVATIYTALEYARAPLLWWYVTRRGPVLPGDIVRIVWRHSAAAIATVIAMRVLISRAGPTPYLLLVVAGVAAYVVYTIVLSATAQGRTVLAEFFRMLGQFIRKRAVSTM